MVQACYGIQKGKLHLLVGQGVLELKIVHTEGWEREGGRKEGEGKKGRERQDENKHIRM